MMNRRLISGCALCLCFLFSGFPPHVPPAYAAEGKIPQKEQIRRIESKLSEESGRLNQFRSREAELLKLVAQLEDRVVDTKKEIAALKSSIGLVGDHLDAQKERLEALGPVLMRIEQEISQYLIALYKYSRQGNVRLLGTAETLSDLRRSINYVRIITEKDRRKFRLLSKQASDCQEDIVETEASIKGTENQLKEKNLRLTSLEMSLDEKVLLLMKIHKEKVFYETSVDELEKAVADLKQALAPTEKEDLYRLDPSLSFKECKGKLPMPVRGKIRSGRKRGDVPSANANGVVIQATDDSPVRAVFKGDVVYSGQLKGYGEVVILSHGGRFFTVSAHLSKREKEKGDQVLGGDIVGWVRKNGVKKGASLYFEVRKADKKLNPRAWLKTN